MAFQPNISTISQYGNKSVISGMLFLYNYGLSIIFNRSSSITVYLLTVKTEMDFATDAKKRFITILTDVRNFCKESIKGRLPKTHAK